MFDIPTVSCRDPVTERHFRRPPQRVDVHAIEEFAWRSIRLRPIPVNLSRLSHHLSHHDRQFFESDLRLPAQLLLGMAGIADQEIDFCRPIVPGIDFDIPLLIKPGMPKRHIVHDVRVTLQSTGGHSKTHPRRCAARIRLSCVPITSKDRYLSNRLSHLSANAWKDDAVHCFIRVLMSWVTACEVDHAVQPTASARHR